MYMRFFLTDERRIDLAALERALRQIDNAYGIDLPTQSDPNEFGLLRYDHQPCGEIEINRGGDEVLVEELDEQREALRAAGDGAAQRRVRHTLEHATAVIAVRALWEGDSDAESLARIEPLWDWLLDHFAGLLQVDGEGYYDRSGLILKHE